MYWDPTASTQGVGWTQRESGAYKDRKRHREAQWEEYEEREERSGRVHQRTGRYDARDDDRDDYDHAKAQRKFDKYVASRPQVSPDLAPSPLREKSRSPVPESPPRIDKMPTVGTIIDNQADNSGASGAGGAPSAEVKKEEN